jgi:hypothetical protein
MRASSVKSRISFSYVLVGFVVGAKCTIDLLPSPFLKTYPLFASRSYLRLFDTTNPVLIRSSGRVTIWAVKDDDANGTLTKAIAAGINP